MENNLEGTLKREQLLERRGWVESINRQLDNLDRRWQLRQKFLEQAKKYIGVPYAQKYHEPGSPEYQSPLFLDCCGLVRRTMRDLKSEFGFLLGPGNQAYQYDTLPISQSEEEMKPGDLVFISGTYLNPQRKRQIHDMVHVEIWLGEGQRTLGARWQRGTVQVFESYRFVSTSYGDMKYHFKSLDTWLQGTCVSHCPEHRWGSSSYHPGKRSIFYPWDDQQEPCEDSWEDPGDSTLKATTMQIIDGEVANAGEAAQDGDQVIEVLKGADSPTEAGQDISVSASLGEPTGVSVPAELRQDGDRVLRISEELTIGNTEDISVKELTATKDDIIQASGDVTYLAPAAAHVKREDTVDENLMSGYVVQSKGASEAADPSRTSKVSQKLRRVRESKEKNDTVKLSRQLTKNTSSSTKLHPRMVTNAKTNKKRWQRRTQQTRSTLGHAAPTESADAEPLKDTKEEAKTDQEQSTEDAASAEKRPVDFRGPGPFFFIGGSNGASLVAAYCLRKGWQRLYDPNREDYKLKWCEIKTAATYRSFREGEQLVYQIPNNKILTTKIGLLQSLREYERVMIKVSGFRSPRILRLEEFFPETYRLDVKEERDNFFAFYQGEDPQLYVREGQPWICKPTGMNQGRGIFLLKNKEEVTTLQTQLQGLEDDLANKKGPHKPAPQARIVQRYIPNPLLLTGRKFDVRSYFLIASTVPYIVFFRHGYVRLTCNIYDPRSDDLTGHLTNQYMQKKHPLYRELKEDTVWTMERFNTYVNERFAAEKRLATDWVLTLFTKRMQQIMIHCFLAVKNKLESKMGYFDLIGCDFLIDEDFKVWFLEMNCNPALHTNCEVLKDVVPDVVNETLDLVLEIFYKSVKHHQIFPLESQKNFVPLFTGDSPYPGLKLSRSRTSLSPPKIPRTLRTDSEEQSPIICKEPEKYPKKAWSLADNSLVSSMRNPTSKFLNRVPLSISQVQVTELPTLAGLSHSVKPKTKYEASDYPSSSTKSETVSDDPELGKFKTTHERSFLGLRRFQIQENESLPLPGSHYDAIARRGEMVHSLRLHSKAPITNQSFEHLELPEPGQIDGATASTSATI